jgi:PAS domain S-box-containing protein
MEPGINYTVQPIDLRRLRWLGVWLPLAAIAVVLLAEGALETYPDPTWHDPMIVVHGLMIVVIGLGMYVSSNWMFGIIRKDREEILQRSRDVASLDRRLRALIENSSDLIVLLSPERTVQYTSPSVAGILGYAMEELTGRDALDLVCPEDRGAFETRLWELLPQPSAITTETIRVQHRDGSPRWMGVAMSNLLGEPSVGAIVCNARDITVRKEAQDSLQWQLNVNLILADLYQPLVSPAASTREIARIILDRSHVAP